MESKEIQKAEDKNLSSNPKTLTQNQGVQTSEKNSESKKSLNNFCLSYKELFINTDNGKEEVQSKQNDKSEEKKSKIK